MRFCVSILSCVFLLASSLFGLDREAFTFTKYQLDVRIEPEQQRLGVRGRITLRNDSAAPQKVAVLQISSTLDWRSIRAGDEPLQFVSQPYTSDIDHTGELSEAVITLPHEVKPKESIELEIGYEGVIPLNATRLTRIGTPEATAKNADWDQISAVFSGVRGIGQVAWYPVALEAAGLSQGKSVFAAVARWKAREADAEMNAILHIEGATSSTKVMCNGTHPQDKNGVRADEVSVQCEYVPLRVTVPTFAVGEYESVSNDAGDFLFLSNHGEAAEGYASSALLVAPLVEEWIGSSKSKIRVLEIPDPGAAPFEAGNLMLMPFAIVDRGLARLTLAHGITHTAFFSQRPWINEGVAHFMQALEREQLAGRKAALDYMGLHRSAFVDAEAATEPAKGAEKQPLTSTLDETFYRSKAMYVWWMLRDMIGDSALKQVLHRYDSKQDVDANYVERLVSAASKRDLGWFFDDWVYQDKGLPDFRVSAAFARKTDKGTYLLTITVENTGAAGAEVPVAVNFEGGEIGQRLEVRAKSKATTRVEVSGNPQQIVVNDGSVPESDLTNNTYTITPQ